MRGSKKNTPTIPSLLIPNRSILSDVCVSIRKSSIYPSNSQRKPFGGGWVAVVQSEVIPTKSKQSEHEGRGMHITSTHPHPHGVCVFLCFTLLLRAPPVGTPLISLRDYDEGNKKTSYLLFSLSC